MDTPSSPLSEHWVFDFTARQLSTEHVCIDLTSTESLLIKTLMLSHSRVCSKQQLILGIDKDIHRYSGLEMCLSRLQNKFKDAFGERLFRSVRNCGYCLVQDLKHPHPNGKALDRLHRAQRAAVSPVSQP